MRGLVALGHRPGGEPLPAFALRCQVCRCKGAGDRRGAVVVFGGDLLAGLGCPAVNVVIDLAAATTPTAVVQVRGRALRRDSSWPGKVADNWAVVCITDDHLKGAADYDRLVRKHDRCFALSPAGDIISGVAHVDPRLSPYTPPPLADFDALNAAMLRRPGQRADMRERWAIGTPYQDEAVATVTMATRRSLGLAGRAVMPLAQGRAVATLRRAAVAGLLVIVAALAALAVVPAGGWHRGHDRGRRHPGRRRGQPEPHGCAHGHRARAGRPRGHGDGHRRRAHGSGLDQPRR